MTRTLAAGMTGSSAEDFLASRPVEAELEAIARAVDLAGETGAKLHIVHVSTGSGVAKAAEGPRARRGRVGGDLPALSVFHGQGSRHPRRGCEVCASAAQSRGARSALGRSAWWPRRSHCVGSFAGRAVTEKGRRLSHILGWCCGRAVDACRACSSAVSTAAASGSNRSRR